MGSWNKQLLCLNSGAKLPTWKILNKSLDFSKSLFPHLQNGDDDANPIVCVVSTEMRKFEKQLAIKLEIN